MAPAPERARASPSRPVFAAAATLCASSCNPIAPSVACALVFALRSVIAAISRRTSSTMACSRSLWRRCRKRSTRWSSSYLHVFLRHWLNHQRGPSSVRFGALSALHCRGVRTSLFQTILRAQGSAAGAAALKSGDAVRWWLLSIALATRGRAGAADPPLKSFSLLGFSRFWGFGVGEKRVKFADAFWRSLLGVFWSIFGQFFIIFWYCPRVKIV